MPSTFRAVEQKAIGLGECQHLIEVAIARVSDEGGIQIGKFGHGAPNVAVSAAMAA